MNLVAIIPSLSALGPLGLLALVAPAVFAALMLWIKRWSAALGALSALMTVFLLQAWWQGPLRPWWWSSRGGLWAGLAAVAAGFTLWAWRRAQANASDPVWRPARSDVYVLAALAAVSGSLVLTNYGQLLGSLGLASMIVLVSAFAALASMRARRGAAECVLVSSLALGCASAAILESCRAYRSTGLTLDWVFEADRRGVFFSPPAVAADRLFLGAVHQDGLFRSGEVYAIDAATGGKLWSFNNDGRLPAVFSALCFADKCICFGDGLHSDRSGSLWCLDVSRRAPIKRWTFAAAGHVESGPATYLPRVYFGAGDDGVYSVNIGTGDSAWHFENLHVDAGLLVDNGVVYFGSYGAADNRHTDLRLVALDAASGKTIWNEPIDLSCCSRPVVADGRVYFSLGTGDFESAGPRPAGAVVAVDAASGRRIWRADVPDGVFGSPLVVDNAVIVGCRDGHVYSFHRANGRMDWKTALGSPVIAAPISILEIHQEPSIVVVSQAGRCVKLASTDGALCGEIDLVRAAGGTTGLFTAAPVCNYGKTGRRIYVAGAITRGIKETPHLFCLSDGR